MSEESKPIAPGGASPDEHNCAICRAWMFLEEGAEWSGDGDDVCNHCAQDELVRLRASLSTAEKETTRLKSELHNERIDHAAAEKHNDELIRKYARAESENTPLKEALGGGVVLSAKDGHFEAMASCPLCGHAGHPHGWAPGRCAQADCKCVVVHVLVARMPAVTGTTSAGDAAPAANKASDSTALEKALGALRAGAEALAALRKEIDRMMWWRDGHGDGCVCPECSMSGRLSNWRNRLQTIADNLSGGAHVDALKAQKEEVK